jgi:hypothetical protein
MDSGTEVMGSVVAKNVIYPIDSSIDRVARLILVNFRQLLSPLPVAMEWGPTQKDHECIRFLYLWASQFNNGENNNKQLSFIKHPVCSRH